MKFKPFAYILELQTQENINDRKPRRDKISNGIQKQRPGSKILEMQMCKSKGTTCDLCVMPVDLHVTSGGGGRVGEFKECI